MARYQKDNRVRVIDPADKRKRVNGTVVTVNEGRGPLEYVVLLDDETAPMGFGPAEIVGLARPVAHNGDVLCKVCGGVGVASCVCPEEAR
jgi:hypothetical protein